MHLFLANTSFWPSYGGPARSVARLATALAEAGTRVSLWAADGSATQSPLAPHHPNVRCLDGRLTDALTAAGRPDVIHDNGLWLTHHHQLAVMARKRAIPRIVSPRGMLEPWARRHKGWKKALAWYLYQKRDLKTAACHHVTADLEASHLSQLRLKVPICCVANGVDLPQLGPSGLSDPTTKELALESTVRTALFVGRLYPVKGLPMLIEAWAKVQPAGWHMHLVGPDEAGHLATLQLQIAQAKLGQAFSFAGNLEGRTLQAAYQAASLFILPSHSENFGMAIGEAFAHRLPVITTQGTPWQMIEHHQCGWWVPPTVEGLTAALRAATSLPTETLQAMGHRGQILVETHFSWEPIAKQMTNCYQQAIERHAGQPA
jgi:glycosyltransferase involved in cell wall biosynthesis